MAFLIASLPPSERKTILGRLSPEEKAKLQYVWKFWRRPEQTPPPGDWDVWALIAGRGAGKNRTASEWLRDRVERGVARRINLVARTAADIRDTVVEGPSGILSVSPPWFRPLYEPSKRRLTWPNGATAITFSAESPESLRGPQCDTWLADETASWKFDRDTFDMLQFGARLGDHPQGVITTTPRPTKLMREILADPGTVVTRGTTYDNRGNLAPSFLRRMLAKYEGTTLGRQELLAEMIDAVAGALWTRELFDDHRVARSPELRRIVVAVDPATTKKKTSADTGIIVAGVGRGVGDNAFPGEHGYVLDDLTCHVSPNEWAKRAVDAYHEWHADRIVGEVNNGGDLVETVIHSIDPNVAFTAVHASRGKYARAEPVAALFEQGRVHNVGVFAELEDQCCTWLPTDADSPDRLDAMVWAFHELIISGAEGEPAAPATEGLDRGDTKW